MLTLTEPTGQCPRLFRSGLGRALLAVVAVLSATLALPAHGQGLPEGLVRRIGPAGPDEIAAIKKFVASASPDLGAQEPAKIKRARQALLEPLEDPQVALPFRIEYGKALEPVLNQFAADKRDVVAINALIIAGELATEQGVGVLEKQLANPDPVVRYAAVRGMGLTFESIERSPQAALPSARAERMVDTLGKQLAAETDARVVDALSRALISAMGISKPEFQKSQVRSRAADELCSRLGARLRAAGDKIGDGSLLDTVLGSGAAVRDALGAANPANRLPDATRENAAKLAGEILAAVARAVRAGKDLAPIQTDDEPSVKSAKTQARVTPAQLTALAEAIISLVAETYKAQGLGEMVKPATTPDDARFLVGVSQVVGDGGVLTKPPFNQPPK